MVKALPDHNIDPSPLGIDNTIAGLGLPELNLKRSLGGLDGLMGMTGFSRNNPLGPAVEERPGETKPVFHSFIPLDEMKSPVMPGAKHKGSSMVNEDEIKSAVPLLGVGQLGALVDSIPDTPLGSVVKSLPVEKIVKRMEKRSRKYVSPLSVIVWRQRLKSELISSSSDSGPALRN